MSRGFQWFFGKLLHGLDCDVQSGLKLFKREIIEEVHAEDVTPWTLDIPLLTTALYLGFTIGEIDITFEKRTNGESKIQFVSSIREIGGHAIKHKFKAKKPRQISPTHTGSMIGAGLVHRGKKFVTHTTLHPNRSALDVLSNNQKFFLYSVFVVLLFSTAFQPLGTAKALVAALSLVYFLDVVFNFYLILKSLHQPPEISVSAEEIAELKDKELPIYTILCPLYREAHVIPQFIKAIDRMDWPKNKLDVQLLLEEDDTESIDACKEMSLPKHVRVVVVPNSQPKTKPKACNYGLSLAKGEYVVIYDAEDDPDPAQLKKSFIAFQKVGPNIKCLQAKLNYYNPHQNWLTRLFTAEYSLWFDVILTGLQSIQTTIPLGGTSNHFRTADLISMQGWDPFNVTEDCDLGVRLFNEGYKTAVIDSTTLEEANSNFHNWIRQRSRWIKGYMQTYLLHMRNPIDLVRRQGIHALLFQLSVGGKISFILINPLLWVLTVSYFVLYRFVGPSIEALYPSIIFYMAVTSLVFGNFMFIYYYMIGCAKREHWGLMKWIYLIPFYWLMVSIAGFVAFYELIVRPHYWQKTIHGLHLKKKMEKQAKEASELAVASVVSQAIEEERVTPVSPMNVFSPKRFTDFTKLKRVLTPRLKWKSIFNSLVRGKYSSGVLLVIAAMIANVLNMATNLYLGHALSVTEFAVFNTYLSILNIVSLFAASLMTSINHQAATLFAKDKPGLLKGFWQYQRNRIFFFSLVLTGGWIILVPWLTTFFQFDSMLPLFFFTPIILISGLEAVTTGFLKGKLLFQLLAVVTIAQPIVRLLSAVLLENAIDDYTYLCIPIALVATAAISYYYSSQGNEKPSELSVGQYRLPRTFFFLSLLSKLSAIAFFSLDNIFVAHYLTSAETGLYGIMGLLGKMIFFSGTLISGFILPITAYQEGKGASSRKIFNQLLLLTTAISALCWFVVGLGIPLLAPQFFDEKLNAVRTILPMYSLGILFYTVAQAIVQFHLAKKNYLFASVSFTIAVLQVLGLQLFHNDLNQVVWVMFGSGIMYLVSMFTLDLFYKQIQAPLKNFQDLFDLFFGKIMPAPKRAVNARESYRILIFNWRDTKHIWSGGAEEYIHEVAKGLINKGHSVTVFCGNDGRHPRNEVIDQVQIIRRGGFYMVYIWAFLYYVLKLRKHFDIVIDSENGVPFLTPLYVKKPILLLIHHVHQEVFRSHLWFPFSEIAAFVEGDIMPLLYKGQKIVTVSNSSKEEIIGLGLGSANTIEIVNPGIREENFAPGKKTTHPSLVYVGRLKPYKNVDIAVKAFAEVVKSYPKATFQIGGSGECSADLKKLVASLGLEKSVTFLGKVSDQEKAALFAKSWVGIQPSMVEGWGITVIEANASGTPVVASNVKGLRDSVQHGSTGYLVESQNVTAFATAISTLFGDNKLRKAMSQKALLWSRQFAWTKSGQNFAKIIRDTMEDTTKHKIEAAELLVHNA
jgi:glycosyltransferase involved in cell wall biosynthesis/cellulose synthase/poly-beta-1,6-N-acetylglucosamine synthase-like glycosyltransferase